MVYTKIIPECPKCKSNNTGEIIFYSGSDIDYACAKYLKRGMIVRLTPIITSNNNCFCEDCRLEWHADIAYKWISNQELRDLKQKKNIINQDIYDMENIRFYGSKIKMDRKKKKLKQFFHIINIKNKFVQENIHENINDQNVDHKNKFFTEYLKSIFITPIFGTLADVKKIIQGSKKNDK